MGSYVGSSEQSDALRVSLNGGTALQLTPFNQMEGKGQAAFAINQFLQEHGGVSLRRGRKRRTNQRRGRLKEDASASNHMQNHPCCRWFVLKAMMMTPFISRRA